MTRMGALLLGMLALPCSAQALRMLLVPVPGVMEPAPGDEGSKGDAIALMREISRRAGIPFHFEFYPQARAMLMVQEEADTCMPVAQLPDLRPMFKWSQSILPIQIVLVARHDDDRHWQDLAQARKLRVGAMRGSMVAFRMKQLGFALDESTDYPTGLRKLQLGRLDLLAMLDVGLESAVERLALPKPRVALVVERSDVAFACNRQTEDDILARLNLAIDAMQQDGSFQKFPLR
ncbi:substrate-binding periplasmic protein [Chromobacterium paludis]|uniref:Transporter substrate-binding domain-containing protein n=1 Tax=Chromobacterium paludis TaxID=2605945 RepID=A0A5C1DFF9_9NEIS|nr:transporter substrate-binding domain-containing protein [Chromobacterium paludis]QEL54699.1 transporter substrate-binding domain-containing protein [Chromobacterium paludis]